MEWKVAFDTEGATEEADVPSLSLRVRDHLGEGGLEFDGLRVSRSAGSWVSAQDYEKKCFPIYYYLKNLPKDDKCGASYPGVSRKQA